MESKNQKDTCQNKLLVFTTILSFIYYAGAKFEKISFGGTSLTFTNEGAITEFIWIIWGYYYIRTYQYYKKDGVQNFVDAINASYLTSFGHYLVGMTSEAFELLPDDDAVKSSALRVKWFSRQRKEKFFRFRGKLKEFISPPKERLPGTHRINLLAKRPSSAKPITLVLFDLVLFPIKISYVGYSKLRYGSFRAIVYPPTNRFSLKGQDSYTVPLPWWMPIRIISVHLRAAVSRPEFIENQGPLIIGLTPIWFFVFRRIGDMTLAHVS